VGTSSVARGRRVLKSKHLGTITGFLASSPPPSGSRAQDLVCNLGTSPYHRPNWSDRHQLTPAWSVTTRKSVLAREINFFLSFSPFPSHDKSMSHFLSFSLPLSAIVVWHDGADVGLSGPGARRGRQSSRERTRASLRGPAQT
jgi:hypothetical protein